MTVNMLLVNFLICFFFNIIGFDDSAKIYKVRYIHDISCVIGIAIIDLLYNFLVTIGMGNNVVTL